MFAKALAPGFEIVTPPMWSLFTFRLVPDGVADLDALNLALIGAIVAELAAGAAGQGTGLAFRITEAGFRLNIPRMFAALTLISLTGIAIYALFSVLSYVFLGRWHDSARARER